MYIQPFFFFMVATYLLKSFQPVFNYLKPLQITNICWITEKAREFQKKICTSSSMTMQKTLTFASQ